MASRLPVGSRAATDFTAGEMTLLAAMIADPLAINRDALSKDSAGASAGSSPTARPEGH